ncbi:MAG: elongation factor P [Chthonomonas sp.]|nr:elongation factor P [Chthonomonas sp.]
MAIDTSDFKNGLAIYIDGDVYQIIEFQHVKPGKGGAFVRTKLRRLKNDSTIEKTFRSGEKFDSAYLEKKKFQYLYKAGDEVTLMDMDTYEQVAVDATALGSGMKFLKEEAEVTGMLVDDVAIGYEVPNFVELEITSCDPGYKGDTVSGSSMKNAVLETGANIQVPYHIKEGDVIKVDTRSESYLERVNRK